jgi:hypothetical protein
MTPPANQNIFLPFDTTGEFLNIFYMNYAFDLTQNIAKTNCDLWTCGLAGWFILKYIIRNRNAKCFG